MTLPSTEHAKKRAKLLRDDLAVAGFSIPHSLALELIAHQFNAKDWNVLAAAVGRPGRSASPEIRPGVPVLRVMSVEVALPFYVDYLGFKLDWEHRFEPGLPLYVQVSRSQAVLHLSEHHGDGSPHGVVWFPVTDVFGLYKELLTRPNAPVRPGIDGDAPGGPTLEVIDPYGNVLRFASLRQPGSAARDPEARTHSSRHVRMQAPAIRLPSMTSASRQRSVPGSLGRGRENAGLGIGGDDDAGVPEQVLQGFQIVGLIGSPSFG